MHQSRKIFPDQAFALAYAGLADAYTALATLDALPPKDGFGNVRAAASKALELDDSLSEAHTALAGVLANYDWNWVEAEAHFKRAIELNPNNALARHRYANYLVNMGRSDEAITEAQRARELDPLSPLINSGVGRGIQATSLSHLGLARCRENPRTSSG